MNPKNPTLPEIQDLLKPHAYQVMLRPADDSQVGGDWIATLRVKATAGSWKFRMAIRKEVRKLLIKAGVSCLNVGRDSLLVKRGK